MNLQIVRSISEIDWLTPRLHGAPLFAFDTETTGLDAWRCRIFMLSFGLPGGGTWVIPTKLFEPSTVKCFLEKIFRDPGKEVVGQNIKFDLHHMMQSYGVHCHRRLHDTQLQAFLIDENRKHGLKDLMRTELGMETTDETAVHAWLKANLGNRENWRYDLVPEEIMAPYSGMDAFGTMKLHEHQYPVIQKHFQSLYDTDCAVLKILWKMEENGLRLDIPYLEQLKLQCENDASKWLRAVWEEAGKEFNVESPKELGNVLFKTLGITPKMHTATGQAATNEDALDLLDHPVIEKLRAYRKATHDLSTFVEGPLHHADVNGYVHGNYKICQARTGRMSCAEPNLQNISKDPRIRRAYLSEPGHESWIFDMAQIEMVGFAHYSQDKEMLRTLKLGQDLHAMTAAAVYHKPIALVTKAERAAGKGANFSIIYGCGVKKLAQFFAAYGAEMTQEECQDFRNRYMLAFPTVGLFSRKVMYTVTQPDSRNGDPWKHYVKNQFGRVRRIDPKMAYTGVNHLIQGWAADLMKSAMVRVEKDIPGIVWKQNIHDAIRVDMPMTLSIRERWQRAQHIVRILSDFPQVSAPVRVTAERFTTNWADVEAHPDIMGIEYR